MSNPTHIQMIDYVQRLEKKVIALTTVTADMINAGVSLDTDLSLAKLTRHMQKTPEAMAWNAWIDSLGDNKDLVLACANYEITKVEAVYTAMQRAI